ncbi:tudor domain-containing 6 [Sphaeramia orbicularis]|uniref:tudor domain-containing 6 n=1 Tax=Sphaeramia orbicularis TaxID=375764 RepID=UPI00117CFBC7|nr:tudor domain-containing protein 6-like [Sphaeramia orbicularis]
MSSIQEFPSRGSDVMILITRVNLHPLCVLVEFWGKFSQERTADYQSLAKDIQSPGKIFQENEGNPGDQCLAQMDGTWYRSRIVSRNGSKYTVFLTDMGMTYNTTTRNLAWGRKEHFILPPEVEFCVLANVLPVSMQNRWSPMALEFLKTLTGKSLKAYVQDVMVLHRMFLLHIPCISKQMYEMGFARNLSADRFQEFVLMSLKSNSETEVSTDTKQSSMGACERLHKQEMFMYPELQARTVEAVIVTEVTSPQRIFCQLKVFSQELKKLSEQLTQCCDGRMTTCIVGPEMIGYPCAARGADGKWYRSVLQQVFPSNKVVEVLNVDFGTKQIVQVENVRPLSADLFRMPVVTYMCSLHGIEDRGVGWTNAQIDYLKTLLLYKTVIAKFEYQSISEGVYYVTLYGEESVNINNLFGSKQSCLLECEKSLQDYAIQSTLYGRQHSAQPDRHQMKGGGKERDGKESTKALPVEDLSLNSSHVAAVHHVSNPSEFWIQTQNYENEFDKLMDDMFYLYKDTRENVVENPTVDHYCAAKAEDGNFYRATVSEVGNAQVKVFFVDYGNSEVVDRSCIRTLPEEFKQLPRLALKCTLVDVKPHDGKWSHDACEFFTKAVEDKVLNVHVMAKYDDSYVVQLTDPEAHGERDLGKLICDSGFAERVNIKRPPTGKTIMHHAIAATTQCADIRLRCQFSNSGMSVQTPNALGPPINEKRIPTFKEQMFSIGNVLDVSVSYIESPNDFWCQLVHSAGHLKMLMHDMQAHYSGSVFEPLVGTACVARHPDNKMWYRALVIHKHETPHVDVLFIDYGQTETISLFDLRSICKEFLTLPGQAFRCSLLNPVDPTSAINDWNEEAIARFHTFVENAASNFVILKCTIYAVMYNKQKIVFNVVDLETPFESICTSMVNLVKSVPPKKASWSSFSLDTYYYSTHNVKTGTEEEVTVTHVNNVNHFYCQLERNVEVIEDLKMKVNSLCGQLETIKLPSIFGTLCFAKYTDGQWYRGQIKATKPSILVHFVDYGDTIEVNKSDLLPVPREANYIMSVPVQALVCALSDVPNNVCSEVNNWFETNATECKFQALVVAREPDGKLLVELYQRNIQVNAKIKKMFRIEMHTDTQVVYWNKMTHETSESHTQRSEKALSKQAMGKEDHKQISKTNSISVLKSQQVKNEAKSLDVHSQPDQQLRRCSTENRQRIRNAPLELYKPPHQRQSCVKEPSNAQDGSEESRAQVKSKNKNVPKETQQFSNPQLSNLAPQTNTDKLPNLADLPSKTITPGLVADVYISHCNSPLSFFVQFVSEEDEIFSIVEKLNDPLLGQKTDITDVQSGNLVQAEFTDDSSWYRAVVREMHAKGMVLVEFVDFGNTAIIPLSKIGRLHERFLQLPIYSTHCMLSNAAPLRKEEFLNGEVVSAFKTAVGSNGEKQLTCRFVRQSRSVWEVSLEEEGMEVVCKVPVKSLTDDSGNANDKCEQVKEELDQKLLQNPCCLYFSHQDLQEGQQLDVYITAPNDDQTFWCQAADSKELDKITLSLSEFDKVEDPRHIDTTTFPLGSPCIALFSKDQHWYRAEVIDKDGDELSVLFVDYGNQSKVKAADVKEITPVLMESPTQAFLCELEGFDSSNGSWDYSAAEELSALTTDKLLQLTITRVIREAQKIRCFVQIECEGQVINEVMKCWWKSCMTEPDPVALSTSSEAPLSFDSAMKEMPLPDQSPHGPETDISVPCIDIERNQSQEHFTDDLVELFIVDQAYIQDHSPRKRDDSPHTDTVVFSEQDRAQMLSECSPTTSKQITESLTEPVYSEEEKMVPTVVTDPIGILLSDFGIDKTLIPPPDNEFEQVILTLSCQENVEETDKESEEEGTLEYTTGPEDVTSPLDDNLEEAKDECKMMEPALCQPEDVNTFITEDGSHIRHFSIKQHYDLNEGRGDSERAIAETSSVSSVGTVKMVQAALVPTSCELPAQQPFGSPTEQETEAGEQDQQEETPCPPTHMESLMTEEEVLSHHEALLVNDDTAVSEPQTCTVTSTEKFDRAEEATCSAEKDSLSDVCTDPNEQTDDVYVTGATGGYVSSMTAEETVICITLTFTICGTWGSVV